MRLLIRLNPLNEPASLPLDNYPLAALIYRAVWTAAPDYAEFLHEEGYPAQEQPQGDGTDAWQRENKRFKFFVFSRIEQPGKRIADGRQWLARRPLQWQVSSPIDEQMELLAAGFIAQGMVSIGDKQGVTDFSVSEIIQLPAPRIASEMVFKTLSPLFVAVDETKADGSRTKQHLRAEDSRFAERVKIDQRKLPLLAADN